MYYYAIIVMGIASVHTSLGWLNHKDMKLCNDLEHKCKYREVRNIHIVWVIACVIGATLAILIQLNRGP